MNEIKRGAFRFKWCDDDLIEVYLGCQYNAEDEFICTFHHSYLETIIAGLTALKQIKR